MQHVVSQLIDKRKELDGEINYHLKKTRELVEQLKAVDTSILLFDPSFNPKQLKAKRFSDKERHFKYGELLIFILDALRENKGPMTTSEIKDEAMTRKRLDVNDKELSALIFQSVRSSLYAQEKRGVLMMSYRDDEQDIYWSINQSNFKPKN